MKGHAILAAAALAVATANALAAEKSLFERNSEAIQRAERQGNVGGRATGPDTGPGRGEGITHQGLGTGRGGGNAPGGANDRAIRDQEAAERGR